MRWSHLKTWRRAHCGSRGQVWDDRKVRVFDPVAGGEALVVLEGHTNSVDALAASRGPGDGRAAARERSK